MTAEHGVESDVDTLPLFPVPPSEPPGGKLGRRRRFVCLPCLNGGPPETCTTPRCARWVTA